MKLNYPIKDAQQKQFLNNQKHYDLNEKCPPELLSTMRYGGWFPVGRNGFFHGGVHLYGQMPVHAIADGQIVAYRLSDNYIQPSTLKSVEGPNGRTFRAVDFPISHNFVLTRHEFTPPDHNPIQFYLLYLHLLPLGEHSEDQESTPPIFLEEVYRTSAEVEIKKLPIPSAQTVGVVPPDALIIPNPPPKRSVWEKQLFSNYPEPNFVSIKGYIHNDEFISLRGDLITTQSTVTKQLRHQAVKGSVFCPHELKIFAGDILGWTGSDGSTDKTNLVHLELFMTDKESVTELKKYTDVQIKENPELKDYALLQLNTSNILTETDINATWDQSKFRTNISPLLSKSSDDGDRYIPLMPEQAVVKEEIVWQMRRMVVKHHSEWIPFDKNDKIKTRLEGPPTNWTDMIDVYKELYFEKFAF